MFVNSKSNEFKAVLYLSTQNTRNPMRKKAKHNYLKKKKNI